MRITPRIESLKSKKLIGQKVSMSLVENKTGLVWSSFSPRIKEIEDRISEDRISLQVYPYDYYDAFNPNREFEKWATVEVSSFNHIPKDMEAFSLPDGLYAVFDYKGSSNDSSIFQFIFTQWLPDSKYSIDNRPHFEVLGQKYKNNDPDSEEEIWIPIKV